MAEGPVPDMSIVYYEGTWPQRAFSLPPSILKHVVNSLNSMGLAVRASEITSGVFGEAIGSPFNVRLTLEVENGLGFSTTDDVISLVRGAVYAEVGEFPTADNVPRFKPPRGGVVTGGAPSEAPREGCISGTSQDLNGDFSLSCWFSNLTGKGLSTIGLLAIGALVGLVLIFQGRRVTG